MAVYDARSVAARQFASICPCWEYHAARAGDDRQEATPHQRVQPASSLPALLLIGKHHRSRQSSTQRRNRRAGRSLCTRPPGSCTASPLLRRPASRLAPGSSRPRPAGHRCWRCKSNQCQCLEYKESHTGRSGRFGRRHTCGHRNRSCWDRC